MLEMQLKHIVRRLVKSPMFAAMTLFTLAVGVGANTTIFSVVNGVLLKPLPYAKPEQLIGVWLTAPGIGIKDVNASPASYFTYREENRTFQDIGVWTRSAEAVTGTAEPERVDSMLVTASLLPVLGVHPVRGRLFTAADDAPKAPETVILSYGYWQRRFGGDPSALGKSLVVNGRLKEVIGILPENFRFMNYEPALILPLQFNRSETRLGNFSYQAIARLKPEATLAQASADVARMLPLMLRKFPAPTGMSARAFEETRMAPNLRPLKQDVIGDVGNVLWVLMATVGIVLFIACANVANLLLVRADGRQRELAVRAALGASRFQIARDLMLESVMLGIAGGVLGMGVAHAALRLFIYLAPARFPRLDEIGIDPAVVAFAFVVSAAAGLLFGLIPALKYARPDVGSGLHSGGRTHSEGRERHRTRSTLVVVQVALALVLLVGSGLMLRTLQSLRQVQPGFTRPEEILTLRISIPDALAPEPERAARLHHDIVEKISGVAGVTSVSLSNSITMDGNRNMDPIFAEDRVYSESQVPPVRTFKHIAPDFFRSMGNPILAGRDFTWTDIHEMRPVAMISENLARELWGAPAAALGKRIRENQKGIWREVIGVVGDERDNGVDRPAPAIVYWPFLKQQFWSDRVNVRRTMSFAIRSSRAGTESLLKEVQRAIWSMNPDLPLASVRTVREIYDRSMARTSFTLVMLAIAAGMALQLGLVGIYGVISYSISQRTREIGIRMALGAPGGNVRNLFLRHGLLLAGIGVASGAAVAVPLTRLMSALLYGVTPLDPLTYLAVATVLVATALLATYLPARRATLVEPVEALRAE